MHAFQKICHLCWDYFPYSMLQTLLLAVIVNNLKYMAMRAFALKKKKNHFRGGENTTRNQWGDFRFEMILIRG